MIHKFTIFLDEQVTGDELNTTRPPSISLKTEIHDVFQSSNFSIRCTLRILWLVFNLSLDATVNEGRDRDIFVGQVAGWFRFAHATFGRSCEIEFKHFNFAWMRRLTCSLCKAEFFSWGCSSHTRPSHTDFHRSTASELYLQLLRWSPDRNKI